VSPVRYALGFYIPEDGILHTVVRTSNLTSPSVAYCFSNKFSLVFLDEICLKYKVKQTPHKAQERNWIGSPSCLILTMERSECPETSSETCRGRALTGTASVLRTVPKVMLCLESEHRCYNGHCFKCYSPESHHRS
jgi:hypothetical protein